MVLLFYIVLPLILVLPLLASIQLLIFKKKHIEPTNLPNGNMGWPLIGETLPFLKHHPSNSVGIFLKEHILRYGRVFKSNLFGYPTIVSCDHELNQFILNNEEKLFQVSYPKQMNRILGQYSLIIVSGELHKKLRNIAVNFVSSSKSTPDFLYCVEKLSSSMMLSWREHKEISFCKNIKKFTLSLMVKHLLGIEPEEALALKILQDFQTYMKGFISLPIYLPGTAYANAIKARASLWETVRERIKERRKEEKETTKGDFLDVILSKDTLKDDQIVSIVLDIMLGGYETTATLIALIVYFLADSPHVLEKLKEEHQAIRKKKEVGEPLNWEDYEQMDFTSNVIHEAMRCGNVVKFLHRKAIKDVQFKEYMIPKEWKVLPIFTGVHFDSSLHENPTQFNPMRWTDKAMYKKVLPFGGGPRLCPGAELAKVEISFFLHHLVLSYRWKTKPDDYPIAYPYVEFKRGLQLEIEPTGAQLQVEF